MATSSHRHPADGAGPDHRSTKGRRWPTHLIVVALVAVATGAVLLVSTASTLRPVTTVQVRPVVFTRAAVPAAATSEPEQSAPRRGTGVTVQAPGWLEADPFYTACTALADGVVEEMLVLEGQRVEKGQVVARLVAEDAELALAAAEASVLAATARVAVAQADVEAARVDWENPVERERAVGIWRASLAETEAELAQLPSLIAAEEAVRFRLHEETERARGAQAKGAASDIEVIILAKRTEAQAASVEALRQREAILAARRDRLEAEVKAAERNAELRISERRTLGAAEADVLRADAELVHARVRRDEARLRLERMVLRAPISGFVQRRLKAPGDKVMLAMDTKHSSQLVHLYDPARIQVRVDVPLADAGHVYAGQTCEVVVEVLPDATFIGEVTRVTHEADLQKNTLQVKVRVIDPSPLLRPEMLTRVKFLADGGAGAGMGDGASTTPRESVRVPLDCLEHEDSSGRVWAIRERRGDRGVAVRVTVTIESEAEGWAIVRGDLHPGDLVAVVGEPLKAGGHVRMIGAEETTGGVS